MPDPSWEEEREGNNASANENHSAGARRHSEEVPGTTADTRSETELLPTVGRRLPLLQVWAWREFRSFLATGKRECLRRLRTALPLAGWRRENWRRPPLRSCKYPLPILVKTSVRGVASASRRSPVTAGEREGARAWGPSSSSAVVEKLWSRRRPPKASGGDRGGKVGSAAGAANEWARGGEVQRGLGGCS